MWTSSSSSCGLSLGPGEPLIGDDYLAAVLLADDCLAGDAPPLVFNGEVFPLAAPDLPADVALAGDPPPPAPLLTNSANSV